LRITPNFTLKELTITNTGLDNTPNESQLKSLELLSTNLEDVRVALGNKPLLISSAFRSKAVNKAVGGSTNPPSAHTFGYAADFQVKGLAVKEICDLIDEAGVRYDQMIEEYHKGTTWVHISFDPRLRQQRLLFKDGKYTRVKYEPV
jgi:zinc D-Ala-D-Ala carboxypeptidase